MVKYTKFSQYYRRTCFYQKTKRYQTSLIHVCLSFCMYVLVCICLVVYLSNKELKSMAAVNAQILRVPQKSQLLTLRPHCSCHFAVTSSDVTSDPFKCWAPTKLSLTCNRGRRGHTLSHADRGRNRGDRGRPPPRTGHLVTKSERTHLYLWQLQKFACKVKSTGVCVCLGLCLLSITPTTRYGE